MDHDELWSDLAKGSHAQLVQRLVSEPTLPAGKVLALRGLRRSGKTTILRRLATELDSNDSPLLPVYIDIHSWWLPLQNRGATIDDAGLYYELADSVLRTAWRFELPTPASDIFLRPFEGQLSLKFGDFEQFLKRLSQDLPGRKPLFLLDEIDSWLDEVRFSHGALALLRKLGDLAENRDSSAILAHTTCGARWRERFDSQIPEALFYRIELLKKQDVEELVDMLPVKCTAWAKELIWRLTGGWPGLLQLLLYMICEELATDESSHEAAVVDMARVRRTLADFLRSPAWAAHRNHFLYSFDEGELNALRRWREDSVLDPSTGVLGLTGRMVEEDIEAVLSLQEKEVLWPAASSGRHHLQVGFLGLVTIPVDGMDPVTA